MFYTFVQNNSGGDFDIDLTMGIGRYVIIEANSHNEANRRAEEIGIYFDGVTQRKDCGCCGDRWYPLDEDEGEKEPLIFGKTIKERKKSKTLYSDDSITIHYKNGKIEFINFKKNV